jgi:hypothetical protein
MSDTVHRLPENLASGSSPRRSRAPRYMRWFSLILSKLYITMASSIRLDSTNVRKEGRERLVVLNNEMEHRSGSEETDLREDGMEQRRH